MIDTMVHIESRELLRLMTKKGRLRWLGLDMFNVKMMLVGQEIY